MNIKITDYVHDNATISSIPVRHRIRDKLYIPIDIKGNFEVVYVERR